PERPWRAAWLTAGVYGDGWTRPHVPAQITVFSEPGQKVALRRALTLSIASPDKVNGRPVSMVSNLERWTGEALPESSLDRVAVVCVPAGGSATVTIETPSVSTIYRDPSKSALTGEIDRPVGVLIRSIAMADETVPMARCP
ncbi:MAG: hypothetical protein QOI67_1416, partial [Gaiellaceae bacterium]|nr:hypothetical protein [Gaiellaceae bacterium]